MGRNNADFKFAHEETIDNLSPSLNKFENKLSNAIGRGVRTTNGVKTMVRVGSDWDKKGAPAILRGKASHVSVLEIVVFMLYIFGFSKTARIVGTNRIIDVLDKIFAVGR